MKVLKKIFAAIILIAPIQLFAACYGPDPQGHVDPKCDSNTDCMEGYICAEDHYCEFDDSKSEK